MSYRVVNYQTGEELPGEPTPYLIQMSLKEPSGTGAVRAAMDAAMVWGYVGAEGDEYHRTLGHWLKTVYVIEI